MNGHGVQKDGRTIAEIEGNLLKAEEAFADADTRFKEAERDRRAALDTINKHQVEFDRAIAHLRQRSIPGSKWRLETEQAEDALVLEVETILGEGNASSSSLSSVTEQFDRLRTVAQFEDDESRQSEAGESQQAENPGREALGFKVTGPQPAKRSLP